MNRYNIRLLLFLTITVVTMGPILGSFYYLNKVLNTTLDIGFNSTVPNLLGSASDNLKKLRILDPEHRDEYRRQFNAIEETRLVYANPQLLKQSLSSSMTIYFGIGIAGTLLLSLLAAFLLSRRIDRSYHAMFNALDIEKDKVRYLEGISSWQGLAKMLAHEIKNPLTPIEVMISSLVKSYTEKSRPEFTQYLNDTEEMVSEEIQHLKAVVNNFSQFATMPEIQTSEQNVLELMNQQRQTLISLFQDLDITINSEGCTKDTSVNADKIMIRQIFVNLVRNGVEANPSKLVKFQIDLQVDHEQVTFKFSNDGAPIEEGIAATLFDPYISTKSQKTNMGLGLTIVKKIVTEHGGEISYLKEEGCPAFIFSLPRAQ